MQIPDELIFNLVKQVAGSDTIALFELLKGRKNVSEFKIAEKMGISVNQVRNMLYRLQEFNLVFHIRRKDKTKGWYIYYWTFDIHKAINLIVDIKQKEIGDYEKEIEQMGVKRYFICKPCRVKISEESALESQFTCFDCGEVLVTQDDDRRKRELVRRIKKNNKDLEIAIEIRDHTRKLAERAAERALAKEKEERAKVRREAAKKAAKKRAEKKAALKKKKPKMKRKVAKKKSKAKRKVVKRKVREAPVKKKMKEAPVKKKGLLRKVFKKKRR